MGKKEKWYAVVTKTEGEVFKNWEDAERFMKMKGGPIKHKRFDREGSMGVCAEVHVHSLIKPPSDSIPWLSSLPSLRSALRGLDNHELAAGQED